MKSSENWVFRRGVVRDESTAYISSQPAEVGLQDGTFTQVLRWTPGTWGHFDIPWEVIAMEFAPGLSPCLISLGAYGDIYTARQTGFATETIDFGEDGPAARGNLRDLRIIGNYVYAAGMMRQVYRKLVLQVGDATIPWERFDAGLLDDFTNDRISGITSIDGMNTDELYACGWGGEIWWFNGKRWQPVESPTNVKLERIFCDNINRMIAVGQSGVVITGRGHVWNEVNNEVTREQFWGGCNFQGRSLLATQHNLYELMPDNRIIEIALSHGDPVSSGWLCCDSNVVWSIGSEHLFWSQNASQWNQTFVS